MQDAEERRLSRINNTTQGGASEGNAADDALMVDQGSLFIPVSVQIDRLSSAPGI